MRKQLLRNFGLLFHTYLQIAGSSASPTATFASEPKSEFSGYVCDGNYFSNEYITRKINTAWFGLFNGKPGSGVVSHFEDTRIFCGTSKPLFAGPVAIDHYIPGRDNVENIRVIFDIERNLVGLVMIHDTDIRLCREILDSTASADFNPNLHALLGYKCGHQIYELEYIEKSYNAARAELQEHGLQQPRMFPMLRNKIGSIYHNFIIWPLLISRIVFENGDLRGRDFIAFQDGLHSLSVFHTEDNVDNICPLIWTNITPFHSTPGFLKKHFVAPGNNEREIDCYGEVFKHDYIINNIKIVIKTHKYQLENKLDFKYPMHTGKSPTKFKSKGWLWPLQTQEKPRGVPRSEFQYFLHVDELFQYLGVYYMKNSNYLLCIPRILEKFSNFTPQYCEL